MGFCEKLPLEINPNDQVTCNIEKRKDFFINCIPIDKCLHKPLSRIVDKTFLNCNSNEIDK